MPVVPCYMTPTVGPMAYENDFIVVISPTPPPNISPPAYYELYEAAARSKKEELDASDPWVSIQGARQVPPDEIQIVPLHSSFQTEFGVTDPLGPGGGIANGDDSVKVKTVDAYNADTFDFSNPFGISVSPTVHFEDVVSGPGTSGYPPNDVVSYSDEMTGLSFDVRYVRLSFVRSLYYSVGYGYIYSFTAFATTIGNNVRSPAITNIRWAVHGDDYEWRFLINVGYPFFYLPFPIESHPVNDTTVEVMMGDTLYTATLESSKRSYRTQLKTYYLRRPVASFPPSTGPFRVRVRDECGQSSGWFRFRHPPFVKATLTYTDDGFIIDTSGTYDVDDGLDFYTFTLTGYSPGDTEITNYTQLDEYHFKFLWSDFDAILANYSVLPIRVAVTDLTDLTAQTEVRPVHAPITYRARSLVRPDRRLRSRAKTVLMQHRRKFGPLWGGETQTGNLVVSYNEGATWTLVSNALQGLSGATVLDFCALPLGRFAVITKVAGNVVFRYSADGQTWAPAVTVCPIGASTSWVLASLETAGTDVITLTNMVDKRFESRASGMSGTWRAVTAAHPFAGVSGVTAYDFCALPLARFAALGKVATNVVFRYSADGTTWGPLVTVCPAGTSSSWCLASHRAAGADILTVTNQVDKRFDSKGSGKAGSWAAV